MSKIYFSKEHEWIEVEGDLGTVGITLYAQEQLGDIVFAEVTKLKEKVLRNDDVAVVESVKAASDIFAPVSGTVIEWNDLLDDAPETLNSDPTKSGWVFKMTIDAPEELQELMDEAAYNKFIEELTAKFPHEKIGIRRFYDECWQVFNCLNAMELLSLEEPRYLMRVFFQHPFACLGLVKYLPQNAGDIARRYISDPELLKFIDMECYCWSVVPAGKTPMINAGMVFSDRHYGGINYPKGGVGTISEKLVEGLEKFGGEIQYKARVTNILMEQGKAVGVRLADGKEYRAKRIVSNATRWDTFEKLLTNNPLPKKEEKWQQRYEKSPSFLSLHLGVKSEVLPIGTECHHILLEEWETMEDEQGTIFVSIPTLLDPSLAPPGHHIIHTFTPSYINEWEGLSKQEYSQKKEAAASHLIKRLEKIFPGLVDGLDYQEVGTPRTHRRFLGRNDGTYGPIPSRKLPGLLGMPFNRTVIPGLYCVGDSTFPGQGLNAVAFSGFACSHRIAVDLGI